MQFDPSRRRVVAGLALTLAAPHIARAVDLRRTLRIGTVNPASSATGQACAAFAAAANASAALRGQFQVEVHANGELGGELEMTKACINGTLDLAVTATNVVSGIVVELGLLDAPFLFRDANHARGVLDGPIGVEYAGMLKPKGINVLAWAENRRCATSRPTSRSASRMI